MVHQGRSTWLKFDPTAKEQKAGGSQAGLYNRQALATLAAWNSSNICGLLKNGKCHNGLHTHIPG